MLHFKKYKLGDIIEVLTDYHANGAYEKLKANVTLFELPNYAIMIRTTNFEQANFKDFKYIDKHAYDFLAKSKVFEGDILMNKIANAGSVYYMPKLDKPVSLAMNLFLIRVNNTIANSKYLFQYLKLNEEYIKNFSAGSVTKTITKEAVRNLEIELPVIAYQREVVKIISSLNDKIELNRRTNQTLEQIAQTLFKKYFVNDIEPENLPEVWRLGRVGDLGKIICGKTPSKANSNLFDGIIPFIKIPDMHGEIYIVETNDSLTEEGANTQKNKFIAPGSICVSCIATVGLVSMTSSISQTNQQINSIIPHERRLQYFTFFLMKDLSAYLKDLGSGGTATLNVNTTLFSNIEIVIPKEDILDRFHEEIEPMMKLILKNQNQIRQLAKIRDSLLPKLMSGEIEVNAIENEFAEA